MGYLVCEKCGGYYKLRDGESPDDFEDCQCGGKLDYYQTIPEHADFDHRKENSLQDKKNELDYELNLYQAIHQNEHDEERILYEKNRSKFFSSNFMVNSGFIILTFTIIPLYFGLLYSNWIFYLITVINIFLSITFYFLKNAQDTFDNSHFQKMFIFTGAVYGLTTLNLLALFGNPEFVHDLLQPKFYSYWTGGYEIAYGTCVCFSAGFCYIFLKNSQMKDKIDFINPKEKAPLYFIYYYTILCFYLVMILALITALWLKFSH